ncbi:MAG: PqqD family protein [Planctomycetota bacterium]|jgi:hypothetical protein
MITETTRFRSCDDVTRQSLGPEQDTVILALASGRLYTCNDTTARFLDALDGHRPLSEITDLLLVEFEVSRETLSRDLKSIAEDLLEEKLIAVVPETPVA